MRKEVNSLIVLKLIWKQRDSNVSSEFSLELGHSFVPFNILENEKKLKYCKGNDRNIRRILSNRE